MIKINTRKEAFALMTQLTKKALKQDDAFQKLDKFISEKFYSKLRNYEIEGYIKWLVGKKHGIVEICPFNGFNAFDEENYNEK